MDATQTRAQFIGLLDAYWNAAYAEGERGATTDTEDGRAGKLNAAIVRDYDALAAQLAAAERANAELNVEVSRLYACRNELQDVTQAMDDPSVNNARSLEDAIHTMKAQLAEAERERDALRQLVDDIEQMGVDDETGCNTCTRVVTACVLFAALERTPSTNSPEISSEFTLERT